MNQFRAAMAAAMILCMAATSFANPALFEVGMHNKEELPEGKEDDGIVGDFIIRNDKIVGVISGDLPLRRANMTVFGAYVTPGTLYDLTFVDNQNDQLTIFAPSGQRGPISYGRIVSDGSDGEAVFETVVSSAVSPEPYADRMRLMYGMYGRGELDMGPERVYKRHTYHLQDGWQGLLIRTTLRNDGQETASLGTADYWKDVSNTKTVNGITVADAVDPADKHAYAFAWVKEEGAVIPPETVTLEPGESITYARFLAVADSPLAAYGIVADYMGETGRVNSRIIDSNGNPIPSARVRVVFDDEYLLGYPDEEGYLRFPAEPGNYSVTIEDRGRVSQDYMTTIVAGQENQAEIEMGPATAIEFDIRDSAGESIPCKAQFIGINGTESPYLGPDNRAHGALDQYFSETGQFKVQLPAGDYRVVVTRGIEYSHLSREISLSQGEVAEFEGELRRLLDTTGWVSCDFHNHSTPSGDNTCGTYDRVISLAAEQVEFAPTTEHNRFYDWMPYIEELGLRDELNTIPGIELTGSGAHFNAFPYEPKPYLQDGGAPLWNRDPRIAALTLQNHQGYNPDRWVQVNHPDMADNFIDRDQDGIADGGYEAFEHFIDGAETWWPYTDHGNILADAPFVIRQVAGNREYVNLRRQFIWLQLLNQGQRYWSVAVSDAHRIHGNGVGGWRTYTPSSTDEPAEIDWREIVRNAKAGRIIITNGPFLEVTAHDGTISGGETRVTESIDLDVKVQCTDWVDIDRIQVMVNGRKPGNLNFTRESHPEWFSDDVIQFDQTINVPLQEDAHLIVVAYGENSNLETGYGSSWQSSMNPCAYNNPIFVDVDGGGFEPNYDNLGYPLPTQGLSVEKARQLMAKNGVEQDS